MTALRNDAGPSGLERRIETTRRETLDWLAAMQAPGLPRGVTRISAAHDPERWPGVLLPGTYNGVQCRALIGGLDGWSEADRAALVGWIEGQRRGDGIFRVAGMTDDTVFKKPDRDETWRYIDWHVTNYSLGAIEAVAPDRAPVLGFVRPWLDPMRLAAWLAHRDMRDPWQEGNNVVNLGSFLLLLKRFGTAVDAAAVDRAMDVLFDWHDRTQEPTTGFWGVGQLSDPTRLLHAFAGSMHNYHLWYATGRPLPGQDHAVDYCLSLPPRIDSACIDVDAIDVLVHGHDVFPDRRRAIEGWLATLLDALLDFRNPDGGFADVRDGVRRQDGWVKGYEEPQGLSNTFATWFRWIAIAMAADVLMPGRWDWRFRRMVGIGYRRPRTGTGPGAP